jgi:putative transposase
VENRYLLRVPRELHCGACASDTDQKFRRQLQYKADRYGTTVILADRWYPSSKLCSRCGTRYGELILGERDWTCSRCGARHERDVNAAISLKRLATGACAAQSALPMASLAATSGTAAGTRSAGGGKGTPARHELGRPDGSEQEQNDAPFRAHF